MDAALLAPGDDPSRAPRLNDCLATFECRRVESIDIGDHVILIGEVAAFRMNAEAPPLLYYCSAYYRGPEGPPNGPAQDLGGGS